MTTQTQTNTTTSNSKDAKALIAKANAEAKAKAQAELKAKQEAEAKKKEEAELKAKQELALKEAQRIEKIKAEIKSLEDKIIALKSQLPAEPKTSSYKKPVNVGVGDFIKARIQIGLGNTEILKQVHEHYGNTNTTYACVAWYRNKLK